LINTKTEVIRETGEDIHKAGQEAAGQKKECQAGQENAQERWNQFVRTTLAYSREELAALAGEIEMTQELFEKCLETCARTGDVDEYHAISEQFPALRDALQEKIRRHM